MSGALEKPGVRDRLETEDDVISPPLFKTMFIRSRTNRNLEKLIFITRINFDGGGWPCRFIGLCQRLYCFLILANLRVVDRVRLA